MRKNDFIKEVEKLYGQDIIDFSNVPERFSKKSGLILKCKIHNEEFL